MKSTLELKCPRCGANLINSDSKDILYCQYCGTKIMLSDENTFTINKNINQNINKTIHTIDDARITRAETERISKMHQIELDKEKSKNSQKMHNLKMACSVFLGLCALTRLTDDLFVSILCVCGIILIWHSKDFFSR